MSIIKYNHNLVNNFTHNISNYFRLPKFKAEVKKMLFSILPSSIARYVAPSNDHAWRSNGHPDVFLSRADNFKCDESRNVEILYDIIGRSPNLRTPFIFEEPTYEDSKQDLQAPIVLQELTNDRETIKSSIAISPSTTLPENFQRYIHIV